MHHTERDISIFFSFLFFCISISKRNNSNDGFHAIPNGGPKPLKELWGRVRTDRAARHIFVTVS